LCGHLLRKTLIRISKTDKTSKTQAQGGDRTDAGTFKNRFSYVTKLSWKRKLSANQYFDVWLYLEFKKNDGKVEINFSANYFSTLLPKKFMVLSGIKEVGKEELFSILCNT